MVIDSFCKILVSGKACKNKIRCILLIGCLMILSNLGIASTRQVSRTMLNTQYGTASGINDLSGVDPSADEKAQGYAENNKLYRIKVSNFYVTTNPSNPNLLCNIASGYANTDENYKNQVWKRAC